MDEIRKIALIPAYEPDEKMINIASELFDAGFSVIVVNDGSDPSREDIFSKVKEFATVLVHEKNRGKGAAIKTGFRYIKENAVKPYVVVTVDADGQHKVEDAKRVVARALKNPDCLVLGSRKFTGKVPFRSRFGNAVTRFVYNSASKTSVRDTQTGLRAVTDKFVERMIEIPGDRYEYEMNMLMIFAKEGIDILEVDIETVYLEENASSHFKPLKDSFRIYKEILKFSVSSLIGFVIDIALFSLFVFLWSNEIAANVVARVISASVNFTLNRTLVFKSKKPLLPALFEYALLAVFILVFNTLILKGFLELGIEAFWAKIITEVIMFTVSWLVQRLLIFGKKKEKTKDENG